MEYRTIDPVEAKRTALTAALRDAETDHVLHTVRADMAKSDDERKHHTDRAEEIEDAHKRIVDELDKLPEPETVEVDEEAGS